MIPITRAAARRLASFGISHGPGMLVACCRIAGLKRKGAPLQGAAKFHYFLNSARPQRTTVLLGE